MKKNYNNYLLYLDGIRAFSIIIVFLYHSNLTINNYEPFKGGFLGVDIFFVISGYLITKIILQELKSTNKFSLLNFYLKRIKRIIPVLIFTILACYIFVNLYFTKNSYDFFIKSSLSALSFISNIFFYKNGAIYGNEQGIPNAIFHTWSLSVEMQFYVLFPIFITLIYKYLKNKFFYILIISLIFSLLISFFLNKYNNSLNFYFFPSRMWELLTGSVIAYQDLFIKKKYNTKYSHLLLPQLGFFLILINIFLFNEESYHPSIYTIPSVLGIALIIKFSDKKNLLIKIFSKKILVGLGLISYSLYVIHYPVIVFIKSRFFFFDNKLENIYIVVAFIITILLSIFSYYVIEKPFRSKLSNNKVIIFLLFVYSIIFAYSLNEIKKNKNENYISNNLHVFLNTKKYDDEVANFKLNYNYNNFDNRKNIFIVGDSYADDLLGLLSHNQNLINKFYFYTPSKKIREEKFSKFNFDCFVNFLTNRRTSCNGHEYGNHLFTQYNKASTIILSQRDITNQEFNFNKYKQNIKLINDTLKKDKKNLIIFFNDVNGKYKLNFNSLDRYIFINNKIPKINEMILLEKEFYNHSYESSKLIKKNVTEFFELNQISFFLKSNFLCDHKFKKCDLISKDGEKMYKDYGHLTKEGFKYFSLKFNNFILND